MDQVTSTISFLVVGDNALSAGNAGLKEGATLVSASGQIVATIGSVTPAGTIATNPAAAMVTVMKITVDIQAGRPVQRADLISAGGNLIATAAAIACFIPGGQPIGTGAIILGNLLNIGGLVLDRDQIGDAFKSVYDAVVDNGSVPVNSPNGATLQSFIAEHNGRSSGGASVAAAFNPDNTVDKITSYDKSGNVIQTDSYSYAKDSSGKISTVTESLYNVNGTLMSTTATSADSASVTTVYNNPADTHLVTVTSRSASGQVAQIATTVADKNADTYDTAVTDGSGKLLYTRISTYESGVLSNQTEYDPSGALTRQYSFWNGMLGMIKSYADGVQVGKLEYRYDENGNFIGVTASGTCLAIGNNLPISLDDLYQPVVNMTLVGTGITVMAAKLNEPYRAYGSVINLVAGDSIKIIDMGGITINAGAGEAIDLASSDWDTINVSGDSSNLTAADGQAAGITMEPHSAANFNGSGNTIRAAAFASISNSTGNDIILIGNDASVQSGSGNRIVAADGTRVYIDETNDTLIGNNEIVTFGGSLTLQGTGDVITGFGTLTLVDHASVTFNGAGTINAGVGNAIMIGGDRSSVTINANGDAAGGKTRDGQVTGIALGRAVDATIVGAGNAVTAAGNNHLKASHDDIIVSGTGVFIDGASNHITAVDNIAMTLSSLDFDSTITGNGETIASNGQGSLTLRGTGDIVTATNQTLTLANAGSSLTINGSNNTIVAGAGDTITITGAPEGTRPDQYTLKAASASSIVLGQNVRLSIDGSGNTLTAAGDDDITGSGNTITVMGAYNAITGDHNAIKASGTTVSILNSQNDTLYGNSNTITGGSSILRLEGTGNTVASGSIAVTLAAGVSVTLSGAGDVAYAGADNRITINAATDAIGTLACYVETSNNTAGIVANQGARVDFKGAGNHITTHGAYSVGADDADIVVAGSGTHFTGDNNMLDAADNLSMAVFGNNNVLLGNHETVMSYVGSLTLKGDGDSVMTSGSKLTANGVSVTLTGADNTFIGDRDVLTIGSDTTNLTVQGAGETIILSDPKLKAASLKVSAVANGQDLVLTDSATGTPGITFDGMLAAGNQGALQLTFADGTVWTRAQMLAMAHATGAPNASPPPAGASGAPASHAQASQLIHAMAAFSANSSSADWFVPANSMTADTATFAQGYHTSHPHPL